MSVCENSNWGEPRTGKIGRGLENVKCVDPNDRSNHSDTAGGED